MIAVGGNHTGDWLRKKIAKYQHKKKKKNSEAVSAWSTLLKIVAKGRDQSPVKLPIGRRLSQCRRNVATWRSLFLKDRRL